MRQAFEGALEFVAIAGQRLDGLHLHAKRHYGDGRGMIGETPGELPHSFTDARGFFAGHAARDVDGEDDCDRTRRTLNPFDVEGSNRPLDTVFEELEILFLEIANQSALGVGHYHVEWYQIRINFDYVLRFVFGRQRAAGTFLRGRGLRERSRR